jgi:RNA polymerase sigma-70 factor (ECF subfamily)
LKEKSNLEHSKNKYHQSENQIQKEEEILKQAIKTPNSFAPIYEKYYLSLFKFVLQRVENEIVASEIVSDVFAKAIFNLKKYKFKGTPFSAWLFRVAYNEIMTTFRKQKKSRTVNLPNDGDWSFLQIEQDDDNYDNTLSLNNLKISLEKLKPNDVELIEMRFFEQRSFKEIGEILEITTENARVKTHRALKKLQTIFNSVQ